MNFRVVFWSPFFLFLVTPGEPTCKHARVRVSVRVEVRVRVRVRFANLSAFTLKQLIIVVNKQRYFNLLSFIYYYYQYCFIFGFRLF